jgi:hypothetical protein
MDIDMDSTGAHWKGIGYDMSPMGMSPMGLLPVMPPPQAFLPGMGTSMGSALHGTGMCRPCAWFWKPQGCANGNNCFHCHLCPEGEIAQRKKSKLARMQFFEDICTEETAPVQQPVNGNAARLISKNSPRDVEISKDTMPQMITSHDDCIDLPASIECELQKAPDLATEAAVVKLKLTLAAEGIPMSVPLPSDINSVSAGSELHAMGKCKPCAWFHKPQGCASGNACRHCHMCDERELKNRRKAKLNPIKLAEASSHVSWRSK